MASERKDYRGRLWFSAVLVLLPVMALAMSLVRPSDVPRNEGIAWQAWQDMFVQRGRVLDTGNGNISHTEGQGWGMLFAESQGDKAAFDALWDWTRENLYDEHSGLFAWRFDPSRDQPVDDPNNASDGDLLIAWALLRASLRWDEPAYVSEATALRHAIVHHLVRSYAGYTVLLPGRAGFVHEQHINVNLSYLVMPALRDFAAIEPDGPWADVMHDGRRLLEAGRFGEHALPPDWLSLSDEGVLTPAAGWPPRFGYEGVRIPLYFVWAREPDSEGLRAIRAFWTARQAAWVNVEDGSEADYAPSRGALAVEALAKGDLDRVPRNLEPGQDYYSGSLLLLTQLAVEELSR